MTSLNLIVKDLFPNISSREEGALLREAILQALQVNSQVMLDLTQVILTPSIADEAFGLLCHHLSITELKERVKFANLSATNKALVIRVIGNRFNQNPSSV